MKEISMPASDAASTGEIISHLGQLTRMLRDNMRILGRVTLRPSMPSRCLKAGIYRYIPPCG